MSLLVLLRVDTAPLLRYGRQSAGARRAEGGAGGELTRHELVAEAVDGGVGLRAVLAQRRLQEHHGRHALHAVPPHVPQRVLGFLVRGQPSFPGPKQAIPARDASLSRWLGTYFRVSRWVS